MHDFLEITFSYENRIKIMRTESERVISCKENLQFYAKIMLLSCYFLYVLKPTIHVIQLSWDYNFLNLEKLIKKSSK